MQAVRDLRKVLHQVPMSQTIHAKAAALSFRVKITWAQRTSTPGQQQADAATRIPPTTHPLPLFPVDAMSKLATDKEDLRRSTRALIPPCGSNLPGGLTRREEVALRRIRVGAALTPAVTHTWPPDRRAPFGRTCPFCTTSASTADIHHLLWTCRGLQRSRQQVLHSVGLNPGRPPDYRRWLFGPYHRSLLDFLSENFLFTYI